MNEEALAAEHEDNYNYITEEEDEHDTDETQYEEIEEPEITEDNTNLEEGIEKDEVMIERLELHDDLMGCYQ